MKREYIIIVLFTFFIMFASAKFFPLPEISSVSLWPIAHWGLTYETGFIYRGLMGTVAAAIFGKLSFETIYYISLFLIIVLGSIFSHINIKIYKQNNDIASMILILFIVSQPSGIRWWATSSMFGRLDIILVIIAVVVGIFLTNTQKKIMFPLAFLLSVIAILTHESFAILFSSTLFALMLFEVNKEKAKLDLSPLLFYYLPTLIVFVSVTLLGKISIPLEEFKSIVSNNFVGEMQKFDFDLYDVYVAGIGEKVVVATQHIDKLIIAKIILTFAALLPELIFIGHIFNLYLKSKKQMNSKVLFIVIILSLFAPLVSIFFGYDFFRWIGYFVICVIIVFIRFYLYDDTFRKLTSEAVNGNKMLLVLISVANISLGCFMARITFPLIEEFLKFILAT